MTALRIEKFANAFVPDAVPSAALGGAALRATDRFSARQGGLWVGGKVTASSEGLRFVPNGLNKVLHVGLESMWIPLADIHSVAREFGVLTGIVVVHHARGEFRFRCFGARRVAAELTAHLAPKAS